MIPEITKRDKEVNSMEQQIATLTRELAEARQQAEDVINECSESMQTVSAVCAQLVVERDEAQQELVALRDDTGDEYKWHQLVVDLTKERDTLKQQVLECDAQLAVLCRRLEIATSLWA